MKLETYRACAGISYLTCAILPILPVVARAQAAHEASPQAAQSLPSVSVTERSRHSFEQAFAIISEQAHVAIFAEGVPFHSELTDSQLKEFDDKVPQGSIGAEAAVNLLAAAFDYDAEKTPFGTFILTKRHSDPADLPDVTYEEVVHSLRLIVTMMDQYSPEIDPSASGTGPNDSPQTLFASSLTPQQAGPALVGISAAQLTQEQRHLAMNAAAYVFLRGRKTCLRETLDHLITLNNPHSEFSWMSISNQSTLGYHGPFGKWGADWQFLLSNGFHCYIGGAYAIPKVPASSNSQADPSKPTDSDVRLAPGMFANRLGCTSTIASALTASAAGGETRRTAKDDLQIDAAIAGKPVSVFGEKYCNFDSRIRSISRLYGLRLLIGKKPAYNLTLPGADFSSGFGDVPEEVARLTPRPLLRYVSRQMELAANLPHTPISPPEKRARAASTGLPHNADAKAVASASNGLYYPAVRRALVVVAKAVPSAASPAVPIVKLDPEVRRLVTLEALSGQCLIDLYGLTQLQLPEFFMDPSVMHVQVSFRPNRVVSTGFGSTPPRKPDGSLLLDFGNTIISPAPKATP